MQTNIPTPQNTTSSFAAVKRVKVLTGAFFAALSTVALADVVTVNVASVSSTISHRPLGMNMDYLMDHDPDFRPGVAVSTTQGIDQIGPRFLRFPGGEKSDAYLWSVPPFTSSIPTLARTGAWEWPAGDRQFTNNDNATLRINTLNFDAFIALCRKVGAEPVCVVCYDSMYKAATPGGTAPTRQQLLDTAREWVRYANITKQYNVKYWEIGNETDYGSSYAGSDPGATQYAADLIAFSQAMKAVDPTIKIGANGHSSSRFQTIITNAAPHIDFLAVHSYPTPSSYTSYRDSNPSFTGEFDMAVNAINNYASTADKSRLKVALTEVNAINWNPAAYENINDLGHSLVVFEMLGQHLRKPKLDFALLWNSRWVDNNEVTDNVGTTNFVANPGFESDFASWTYNWDASPGVSTITTVSGTVRSGSKAMQISGTNSGGRAQDLPSGSISPGQMHTLKVWGKSSATSVWSGVGIDFYKSGIKVDGFSLSFNSTSYKRHSAVFTAPVDFDGVQIWASKASGSSTVHIDDLSVVAGAAPSVNDALSPKNQIYPIGRALTIWDQFMGEQMLATTSTTQVRCYATYVPGSKDLAVFLVNKATSAKTADLAVSNYTGASSGQRWTWTGTSPEDLKPAWSAKDYVELVGGNCSVSLPPVSITVLRFAANMVHNAGFEQGGVGWEDWGNSFSLAGGAQSGTRSLQVGPGGGGRGQTLPGLRPGLSYTLKSQARLSALGDGAYVGVTFYNAAGSQVASSSFIVNSTTWAQRSVTFTAPSNFAFGHVWVYKNAGTSTLYLDSVEVTKN